MLDTRHFEYVEHQEMDLVSRQARTTTDAQGRFVFDRVPQGELMLARGPNLESPVEAALRQ
jgi:hypothetical protein